MREGLQNRCCISRNLVSLGFKDSLKIIFLNFSASSVRISVWFSYKLRITLSWKTMEPAGGGGADGLGIGLLAAVSKSNQSNN